LHKNIPIGAGLGGGSADASFFIRMMNQKFDLQMDNYKMEHYASKIGSDCAFFIQNKPHFFNKNESFFSTFETLD
jgi:4-diphosphocytidyl-2-C-methyl-D-erythritol kinase